MEDSGLQIITLWGPTIGNFENINLEILDLPSPKGSKTRVHGGGLHIYIYTYTYGCKAHKSSSCKRISQFDADVGIVPAGDGGMITFGGTRAPARARSSALACCRPLAILPAPQGCSCAHIRTCGAQGCEGKVNLDFWRYLGPVAIGRHTTTKQHVQQESGFKFKPPTKPGLPSDLLKVNNFQWGITQ